MNVDREKIIQDILEVQKDEVLVAAGAVLAGAPIIGGALGGAYTGAKGSYYKLRKRMAKHGSKGKWQAKIQKNRSAGPKRVGRGILGGLAVTLAAPSVLKRGEKFKHGFRKGYKRAKGERLHQQAMDQSVDRDTWVKYGKPVVNEPLKRLAPGVRESLLGRIIRESDNPERGAFKVERWRKDNPSRSAEAEGAIQTQLDRMARGDWPPKADPAREQRYLKARQQRSKRKINEVFLYGGVGQLRRSRYGPNMKRGSRVRAMFPPRILSTQDRTKSRYSASIRFKALDAFRKQTKFPHKPLAQPAVPARLIEAYKHKLASRDRALAKHGMAPAVSKKAFKKSVRRQVMKIHKKHKNIRRSWVQTRKVSAAADQYAAKHAREWLKEAKMTTKSKLQQVLETYYGQGHNTPSAPSTPAPVTTSKSYYTKEKRKGDKTSWSRGYKPSTGTLRARVIDYHQSHRSNVGSALGLGVGAVGGMVAGGVGGYLGGKRVGKDFAEVGAVAGMTAGGIAGGFGGSSVGHKLGFRSGTKRGKTVTRMIPSRPGVVRKLQTDEPREAKRWFPKKGKEARKHKKLFYHKDYATKTHTTTASVEGGRIKVKQSTSRGKSRRKGSVKTGFAKHGYYREDVVEALVEATTLDKIRRKEKIKTRVMWGQVGVSYKKHKAKQIEKKRGTINLAKPKVKLKKKQSSRVEIMRALRHQELRTKKKA